MSLEIVYGIYSFLADCDEELDFKYGEPIIVLEKDEMYGDGWWKGRNIRGRIGLFPMNYTSKDNPRDPLELKNLRNNNLSKPESQTPYSIDETIDELQEKLQRMVLKNDRSSHLSATTSSSYVSAPINSEKNSPRNSQLSTTFDNPKILSFSSSSSDNNYINKDLKIKNHPATWDVQQVCKWLSERGYGSETNHFIENDITGDILLELNLVTLKEINVSSFGKRIRLKNEIASLKNQYSANGEVQENQAQSKNYSSTTFSQIGSSEFNGINVSSQSNSNIDEIFSDVSKAHSNSQRSSTSNLHTNQHTTTIPPSSKDLETSKEEKSKIKKEKIFNNNSSSQYDDVRPTSEVEKVGSLRFILRKNKKIFLDRKSLVENQLGPFKELSVDESHDRVTSYYSDHSSDNYIDDDQIIRIGVPDHQGSLMKQGDKYKTWRNRFCILKGSNLYYLQDDKMMEKPRVKGHINLTGYRVIPDENIYQGKYGFKLFHDNERPHFFAHEDLTTTRDWMKAIIKATIERNIKAPVVSSNNVSTITLSEAVNRMVPSRPAPSPPMDTNNNSTLFSMRPPSNFEHDNEKSSQHKPKAQSTGTLPSFSKPSNSNSLNNSRPTSPESLSKFTSHSKYSFPNNPTKKRIDSVINQPKFPSMSVSLLNAHRSPSFHENKFSGISMGYYV
ncbi:19331_t:CDS:2 [Funneliformis geosporum]|uniref:19416_t:CDS:1 n=1 Tax=Funneliformis geosporum TaxID=1117311 RepID=A0A9W4WSL2_9GLOM|nr:19331_t:CDS:2 [Funneliformis geosporum]CAI2169124.1 19416_t:CDS:2 [Funneliformis geosporum]